MGNRMKPRYALKVDDNQQEIVDALRQIGCSVEIIGHPVDLLVGRTGSNGKHTYLIECKNPNTDYGKNNRSTRVQREFLASWKGQVRIVETAEEAIELVRNAYGRQD